MDEFKGKVVIITGASSGIGAATAEAYAKQGTWLSLTGRDEKRLKATAEKCQSHGVAKDKVLLTICDLVEAASYDLIVKNTVERFGKIDIVVNNAGAGASVPFESETIENVDHLYKLLLRAPFFLSQKALPFLKETKGCIINVSSDLSTMVLRKETAYSMLKAGLDHLTHCLAIEAAPNGVRTNSVNPGVVRTPLPVYHGLDPKQIDKYYKDGAKDTPLGRVTEPSEVAATILFLTSAPAMSITGANLVQDGAYRLASAWTQPSK